MLLESTRVVTKAHARPVRGHPFEAVVCITGDELRSIARAVDAGRAVHVRGTVAKTARGQAVQLTFQCGDR